MPTVRFRQTAPPDYTEAIAATQRYRRSYARLSRSMQQTYGPIPREYPGIPSRQTDDVPLSSSSKEISPAAKRDNDGNKTLVTAMCIILALTVISVVVGGQLVSSLFLPPGDAPAPTASTSYSLLGPPSISSALINQVLAAYHSPAAGKGQRLYELGVQYGIDPVFALAFFMHESTFGTVGEARFTRSLGNLRCISARPCTGPNGQGYAIMKSWEDGFAQWYQLIDGPLYKEAGLTTIATIIPRYAPQADHNDETAYIRSVEHAVDTWRAGKVVVA